MTTTKKTRKIPAIPKSVLPYPERLRRYHREKDALIQDFPELPAVDMEAALRMLAKKWGV